jgi:hypothetical protein
VGACLTAGGCGSGASVTGKITNGGEPLQVSDKGHIVVTFSKEVADAAQGDGFGADLQPDGTFRVVGKTGGGIPPGKYRISVQQFDPYPTTDKLKGKFAPGKSPIVRDITGTTTLNIDLSKPEG